MEINQLIGTEFKIQNLKYNSKTFQFEVTCIMPGQSGAGVYAFDTEFFPNHSPIPFLDEMVQVGEQVHVWIKEEILLKSEGWRDITKHTISNPDSPFKIGKKKKILCGGAHKGIVHVDENFQPFIFIKGFRFSPLEIKCILRSDILKNVRKRELVNKQAQRWVFDLEKQILFTPYGNKFVMDDIYDMIALFRQANLI